MFNQLIFNEAKFLFILSYFIKKFLALLDSFFTSLRNFYFETAKSSLYLYFEEFQEISILNTSI